MSRVWYIVAGMLALSFLARPAAAQVAVLTGGNLLDECAISLSASQRANAQIIIDLYREQFLPDNLIAAAIVNSYAESTLNARAKSPGGTSWGLFQLHDKGYGDMTPEERMDPVANTLAMLNREVTGGRGKTLRERAYDGAGAAELAALFCKNIERPGDQSAAMAARTALAQKMFPGLG